MKKLIILLTFLLFIPNINASPIYDFKFTREDIYDYANLYGEMELERLNDKIKEFELKSSIDLNVITVSSSQELITMTNELIAIKVNNKKSIYLPTVVIILSQEGEMNIVSDTYYDEVWNRKALQKFETYKILPYDNVYIHSTEMDLLIQDWIDYFDEQNLINVVLMITISLLVTLIIVRLITKKYRPSIITEADKYIKEDKIIVK